MRSTRELIHEVLSGENPEALIQEAAGKGTKKKKKVSRGEPGPDLVGLFKEFLSTISDEEKATLAQNLSAALGK